MPRRGARRPCRRRGCRSPPRSAAAGLSWGADPPRGEGLPWEGQSSWRVWLAHRLARALLAARAGAGGGDSGQNGTAFPPGASPSSGCGSKAWTPTPGHPGALLWRRPDGDHRSDSAASRRSPGAGRRASRGSAPPAHLRRRGLCDHPSPRADALAHRRRPGGRIAAGVQQPRTIVEARPPASPAPTTPRPKRRSTTPIRSSRRLLAGGFLVAEGADDASGIRPEPQAGRPRRPVGSGRDRPGARRYRALSGDRRRALCRAEDRTSGRAPAGGRSSFRARSSDPDGARRRSGGLGTLRAAPP